MKILISNDDGFNAKGICTLMRHLSTIHEVVLVAPSGNKSAASSSLTLNRALKPIRVADNIYHIDATPSDCVHLALNGFLQTSFDLVVTGINFGANMGDDVIYSGTVAGAIEGRFLPLPSIAISLASWRGEHFDTAGRVIKKLIENIQNTEFDPGTVLNVNVPDVGLEDIKGFQATRLGARERPGRAKVDSKNSKSFWIGENGTPMDAGIGTDFYAVKHNFVSITPLQIDLSRYSAMDRMNKWLTEFKEIIL
jgi:5'-nucleotidase